MNKFLQWDSQGELCIETTIDESLAIESIELSSNVQLTTIQTDKLSMYIQQNKSTFQISGLTLFVSQESIQDPAYIRLLKTLENTHLHRLDLIFPIDQVLDDAFIAALDEMSQYVTYPVLIRHSGDEKKHDNPLELSLFTQKVIANMQRRNSERLLGAPITYPVEIALQDNALNAHIDGPKIKLKELMSHSDINIVIQIEEQHIEQQEILNHEQQVVEEEQQQESAYNGVLIDFEDFQKPPYRNFLQQCLESQIRPDDLNVALDHFYDTIQHEFFGELPHSIQYFSPEAAKVIASNAIAFAALNVDNLPQNFVKKDKILDYNPTANEQKINQFTPKKLCANQCRMQIYTIEIPEILTVSFRKYRVDLSKRQIDNAFIRYGKSSIEMLLTLLSTCDENHPGLAGFLCQHYLGRYQQWDALFDEPDFLHAFDKIAQYDETQLNCLKAFINSNTDDKYPFNLLDVLHGFEAFWKEWIDLARQNKINPSLINNHKWKTPGIGNPVVYMERLLTILRNSRDLNEQLNCLGGFSLVLWEVPTSETNLDLITHILGQYHPSLIKHGDKFWIYSKLKSNNEWTFTPLRRYINGFDLTCLPFKQKESGVLNSQAWIDRLKTWKFLWEYLPFNDSLMPLYHHFFQNNMSHSMLSLQNYGPYYASKFEGFKVVAPEMALIDEHKIVVENKGYRTTPKALSEMCVRDIPANQFYEQVYRFIGQQLGGVRLDEYIIGLQRHLIKTHYANTSSAAVMSLFIVAHDRYKSSISIEDMLFELSTGIYSHRINNLMINNAQLVKILMSNNIFAPCPPEIQLEEPLRSQWDELRRLQEKITIISDKDQPIHIQINKLYQDLKDAILRESPTIDPTQMTESNLDDLIDEMRHKKERALYLQNYMQTKFLDLFQYGIRLNSEESIVLFQSTTFMIGNNDFSNQDIINCCDKIFNHLQNNNYATINYLNFLSKEFFLSSAKTVQKILSQLIYEAQDIFNSSLQKMSSPLIFALDTADFLMKDVDVNLFYRDDLLLFAELLSHNPSYKSREIGTAYCADLKNPEPKNRLKIIRDILHNGAVGEHPNNIELAYNILVKSKEYFCPIKIQKAFSEINSISTYDENAVTSILNKHQFKLKTNPPSMFATTLCSKVLIIAMLNKIDDELSPDEDLHALTTEELGVRLNSAWKKKGPAGVFLGKTLLKPILSQLKQVVINEAFITLTPSDFSNLLTTQIQCLSDFQSVDDFEKIQELSSRAVTLAKLFSNIMKRDNFLEKELTEIIRKVDFSKYEYQTIHLLAEMLESMSGREYTSILDSFFSATNGYSTEHCVKVISSLQHLHNNAFSSEAIARFAIFSCEAQNIDAWVYVQKQLTALNPKDPLLQWMMNDQEMSFNLMQLLLSLTKDIFELMYRNNVAQMLMCIKKPNLRKFIEKMSGLVQCNKILEIMAMAQSSTLPSVLSKQNIDYIRLANDLNNFQTEELTQLHQFMRQNKVSLPCMALNLRKGSAQQSFEEFLNEFQKAPFGPRKLNIQFSLKEVERVVNGFVDLNRGTCYSYQYRKQIMEAFLLVNRAGLDLPLYNNKSAKDLLNTEITELFQNIKKGKFDTELDAFQKRLYAIALMREAMYRTTEQFAFSTQLIELIDCIMHPVDHISNIDTGQGKSLIDTMKGALLWLETGDVSIDISTSSIVDATRDNELYKPFYQLLGIATANSAITSSSNFDCYVRNGINHSTLAQFDLFYNRAKTAGIELHGDQVSLVMNESDYSILDDRTIYRYATTGGRDMLIDGHEWMYDVINQFVAQDTRFKQNNTSKDQDISMLRESLKAKAKYFKKTKQLIFINNLSNEKLLMLIESALIVNYKLRENTHYVLTPEPVLKHINGKLQLTRSLKILMSDGKVSADNQFGNCVQQLLYAKLNQTSGERSFVIEPESKTIIASNNKNRIDYYRSKKGFIWGSSGTVGSTTEIDLQYKKYGFYFSKIEPHQVKKTKIYKIIITKNKKNQFEQIWRSLQNDWWFTTPKTSLVFFQNIDIATEFHQWLIAKNHNRPMQLFIGLGDEAEVIKKAATPGIITITTKALGRNTDIAYDYGLGMRVYITNIDSVRQENQKIGRTGRQGSYGEIYYFLNAEDLKGQDIQCIRNKIEEYSKQTQERNEEFYNIMGYLLNRIHGVESVFFKEQWSNFTARAETIYREEQSSDSYIRQNFVTNMVDKFNLLLNQTINANDLIRFISEEYKPTKPQKKHAKYVYLSDCVSPEIMAWKFLNKSSTVQEQSFNEADIHKQLNDLFSSIHKPSYSTLNNQYFRYLNESTASKKIIKKVHAEFITKYLEQQISVSNNEYSIKQWLGFEGHLNQIMQDDQYLLLFRAMLEVDHKAPADLELDIIKNTTKTLLQEYLQYSWFISKNKREETLKLIESLSDLNSIDHLVSCLNESKINMLNLDVEINKNISNYSFFRVIKPVNMNGESRFQATLDRALALSTNKTQDIYLVSQLKQIFNKTLDATELTEPLETMDDFKVMKDAAECKDKPNAAVIIKSMEKTRLLKLTLPEQIERISNRSL